jgi:DNA-binding GntR family transcriptional regulator
MGGISIGLGGSQKELLHVKDNLAAHFRNEIVSGRLRPGENIVEVQWAKTLGVSQSSVREALNILSAEGFVQKGSGQIAQVTKLSDEDIQHSYELRAVLEGYVARVVAKRKLDLSDLDQSIADMRSAIDCKNIQAFYERDLQFHFLLAEKSGNKMLQQAVKRILLPLFAFVVIRVYGGRVSDEQWNKSLERHQRIVDALKSGDPVYAEHLVIETIYSFRDETNDVLNPAKHV